MGRRKEPYPSLNKRTLRRSVVDARAAFAHLLVRYRGAPLTAVARNLQLSPQAIARAVRRGEAVLARRQLVPAQFLTD